MLEQVEKRLERIEGKLDTYLEKTVRTEEAIYSVRGQIRTIVSIGIAVVTAGVTALLHFLLGGTK